MLCRHGCLLQPPMIHAPFRPLHGIHWDICSALGLGMVGSASGVELVLGIPGGPKRMCRPATLPLQKVRHDDRVIIIS